MCASDATVLLAADAALPAMHNQSAGAYGGRGVSVLSRCHVHVRPRERAGGKFQLTPRSDV
jgi:hypothetical protein